MRHLTVQVSNEPVIVYPGAQMTGDEAGGTLVEGFVQFDLAAFHELDIKVRLQGSERQNLMPSRTGSSGEMQLVNIGLRKSNLAVDAHLSYMFIGGPVPAEKLSLQPGNHIFAFSGRVPHSLPSSQTNSYVTVGYEAMVIVSGKRSSGWPRRSVSESATRAFEVQAQPSVAGPNEGNKMEIRLHPSSTTVSADVPFKAFARSPNARLGGCMHLDLAAVDAGMAEIRFTSLALVLEQHCRLASVRYGPKDHLVCAQALVERSDLTLQSPSSSDAAPPTPPSSIKADMRGMGSQPATLSVSATFPIANTGLSEWIATTAPRTQTNVCITHSLRLHISLVRPLDGVQDGEQTWELASDVVLVGDRLQSQTVRLPEYSEEA